MKRVKDLVPGDTFSPVAAEGIELEVRSINRPRWFAVREAIVCWRQI